MNHTQNAIRFGIAIFWLLMLGMAYTAASNAGNATALGWGTWLFYGALVIGVLYIGSFLTLKLWRIK